jgi:hypothetical protein
MMLAWFLGPINIFSKLKFHGNTRWQAQDLCSQALLLSWSEKPNITDAFDESVNRCKQLGISVAVATYQGFMGALSKKGDVLLAFLMLRLHQLMEEIGGPFCELDGFVPIAFDGSRSTASRTESNENEFCASNHGKGKTAKYRKKQTKGMRRTQNEKNKAAPPKPQIWVTLMWHMTLRVPWSWRLGPSNSSERGHVTEMVKEQTFPKNTLFCGDAGFVGYDFWKSIMNKGHHFLVRVGANVSLLSTNMDYQRRKDGIVYCWPKGKRNSNQRPLCLRLVQVNIGNAKVYLLTSVLDPQQLIKQQLERFYKLRWGIEVEFRSLKQVLRKTKLRCRNARRLYAELNWAILAMAVAELFATKEQIEAHQRVADSGDPAPSDYTPHDRSMANTMRAFYDCLDNLNKVPEPGKNFATQLRTAVTDNYVRKKDKGARYRPKNPDRKPLGDPKVNKVIAEERKQLAQTNQQIAA